MSLCSTNSISTKNDIKKVFWVIQKLGYKEIPLCKELKSHYLKGFFWKPSDSGLIYVGVELYIKKSIKNKIEIETRTRAGRSFIEIQQQNLSIKTIKSFFGGKFETVYGKNKYLSEDDCSPERTPISMALYIQRWRLNNALIPIKTFSDFIKEKIQTNTPAGNLLSDKLGILPEFDYLRPYVVSNNIQLPYIIGAWENYLRNSFYAIFKYINNDNNILKEEKLTNDDLLRIKNGQTCIEECISNNLSFQRPQIIIKNFKKLDKTLDINSIFEKPFKRRKEKLSESIDKIITLRNRIVHDGFIDITLTSKIVDKFYQDVIEASNRFYRLIAKQYNFETNFDF